MPPTPASSDLPAPHRRRLPNERAKRLLPPASRTRNLLPLRYASDAEAEAALDEFSDGLGSTAVEDCVQDLYEDALEGEEDVTVGDIDVGELSFTPPPDLDEASAWQIAVPLQVPSNLGAGEVSVTVYLDLIHLREGDTLVYVSTQDAVTPFDSDLRDDLLEAVANRMSE